MPDLVGNVASLPYITEEVRFYDWEYVTDGTHAKIYKAKDVDGGAIYCIKLFKPEWLTPFNLEKTAYEHLQAANIKHWIPHVYGYASRTLSAWGIPNNTSDDESYYGIVMEWLEGAQSLSIDNVTIDNAANLLEGLAEIHEAGVLHYDTLRRNLMVFPDKRRAVWIDFSCAHMNEEYAHAQEIGTAAGVIMEVV